MEDTHIWSKYKRGLEYNSQKDLYNETERNWNFFIGDQWHGVKLKDKNYQPPVENIVKPIVRLQYSTVAMQKRTVTFSDISGKEGNAELALALTNLIANEYEKSKMDSKLWSIIKSAAIAGDSYLYMYETRSKEQGINPDLNPRIEHQVIQNTNIYLSDEQNPNLNEQEYIIISERLPVSKVKAMAKANGLSAKKIELITKDDKDADAIGYQDEVDTTDGKCTSLLYFEKTENGIKYCKSTRAVVYDEGLLPINDYPIVNFRWEEMIGTARGVSAVKYLVPNQCSINYTLYRREQTIKRTAFPKVVYDSRAIQNIERLSEVGSTIGVDNMSQVPVSSLVTYLNPAPISPDAANYQNELVTVTRDLAGAGNASTGQINPNRASGEAIKAVRDQAAIPLNEQVANEIQFIEDWARLSYKMWLAYSVNGLLVPTFDSMGNEVYVTVTQEDLNRLEPEIKVDVSPIDPYSVMAEDNNLLAMLTQRNIGFEEFAQALPETSNLPKRKFLAIIEKRKQLQEMMGNIPTEENQQEVIDNEMSEMQHRDANNFQ